MARDAGEDAQKAVLIAAPSSDPQKQSPPPNHKGEADEELSEEDKKKKEEIELLVERAKDPEEGVATFALQMLADELKLATSSMTSVPKPLKFLRPLFGELETHYETLPASVKPKRMLADILSVLATTIANTTRKSLHYRLAGTREGLVTWGYEYLRKLSGEIASEFEERREKFVRMASKLEDGAAEEPIPAQVSMEDLLEEVFQIVPFYMKHHNEVDAVDLLCEVEEIEKIVEFVDSDSFQRVGAYLMSLANYSASTEDYTRYCIVAFDICLRHNRFCPAMRIALRLDDSARISDVVAACTDPAMRKQLAYILARSQGEYPAAYLTSEIESIMSNEWMTDMYKKLATELDVLEPKLPDEIYKSHLEERRGTTGVLDSAKQNLASTLVNAFVNAGFSKDGLMTVDSANWLYKNKDHGMISAVASLGSILMWNVEDGLAQIDKYQWSREAPIKAGALMAFGLVCSGVKNECDPAYALLSEQLDSTNDFERTGAILGLGFAYAGARRDTLIDVLIPLVIDTNLSVEISAFAALSLGLSFVGTGSEVISEGIIQTLMERQCIAGALAGPTSYLFGVGLALLFLCQRDMCDVVLEALEAVNEHLIGEYTAMLVQSFAYAGSGDVTRVQACLKVCVEPTQEKESVESGADAGSASAAEGAVSAGASAGGSAAAEGPGAAAAGSETATAPAAEAKEEKTETERMAQAAAVTAMPLIAMGEEIGSEMTMRMLDHLLQYGSSVVRRGVPLALALLSTSNPKPAVVDSLSKLTHDVDADVALHAILSLGLVGAGTNNSRIAGLLRQLAGYYAKSPNALFVVRLSQGLLYLGKGLMTLCPVHADRSLLDLVSLGSLLVLIHTLLFSKSTILGQYHYLLYFVVPAMRPRMLMMVDEDLNPLTVSVRVGQAVDTVGQAGNPRTITGFQTHTTPVLLSVGDRAELATEDYEALSDVLEGVVILRPVDPTKKTGGDGKTNNTGDPESLKK